MAKQKTQASKQPSSYELLGQRIQRTINHPRSQQQKSALLERSANDDPADWDRVLDEIAENDNVTIAHCDDGNVQIFWTVSKED
jgi:hypothetical protein